jgi:site-specific recombinase XerC
MINRGNWKLTKAYLEYRAEVDQVSSSTIRLEETWLRHVLEWANDKPFEQAPRIRPTFPEYMLSARLDGEKSQLSTVYIKKVVSAGKRFSGWLVKHHTGFSGVITPAWLDTLKAPRLETEAKEHEAVTLDEILAMAVAPVYSLRDRRIRAAAVFWFLSGIRIGAFVTLPICAVNLNDWSIKQWPSLGVRTKFTKRATTYLLDIPELMGVVREWDRQVRSNLPETSFWFAPLSPETETFDASIIEVGDHRQQRASKDLKEWLERVGLKYHSPHKFRHGHAVYGLQHSKDVADLKAVSQNLMHSNLSITDGVYGILSSADVGKRIASLGQKAEAGQLTKDELLDQLAKLLEQNRGKSGTN